MKVGLFGRKPHNPLIFASMPKMSSHPIAKMSPPSSVLDPGLPVPGYDNMTLPDCTAASWMHAMTSFANTQSVQIIPDDQCAPAFYGNCIGQPGASNAQLATTDGAVMANVLQYQGINGAIIQDSTTPYPKSTLKSDWFTIDPKNRDNLALSIALLGHSWWGVAITNLDMQKAMNDEIWDDDGSDNSGVAGGHAIIGRGYTGLGDTDLVSIPTWSQLQKATWRWVARRLDESYALIWRSFILLDAAAGAPIDFDRLSADCKQWRLAA